LPASRRSWSRPSSRDLSPPIGPARRVFQNIQTSLRPRVRSAAARLGIVRVRCAKSPVAPGRIGPEGARARTCADHGALLSWNAHGKGGPAAAGGLQCSRLWEFSQYATTKAAPQRCAIIMSAVPTTRAGVWLHTAVTLQGPYRGSASGAKLQPARPVSPSDRRDAPTGAALMPVRSRRN
jgi:hypothetical protein